MMRQVEVPNITWDELTGEHMEHPPYTEATIKRAIIEGVDPSGKPLDSFMPRWEISDADLNDLIDFLKTLK